MDQVRPLESLHLPVHYKLTISYSQHRLRCVQTDLFASDCHEKVVRTKTNTAQRYTHKTRHYEHL